MSKQNNRGVIVMVAVVLIIALAGLFFLLLPESPTADTASSDAGKDSAPAQSDGQHSAEQSIQEFPDEIPSRADDGVPVWESWPRPQLAFLLTIGQHGYFEPCGCTANQLGGMSRRADLLAKLENAGWEVRGIDGGGLARRTSQQAAMKMDTSLKALHQMKYLAVGMGTEELLLGVDKLLEVHMNLSNAEASVPFVSGNVTFLDGALEGFPLPYRIVEAGGLKIGIASVLSPRLKEEVFPLPESEWTEAEPAIEAALQAFNDQSVDVRVLLSQSEKDESKAFAEKFPAFDFVLTARGSGDPNPMAQPEQVGDTLIIEPGRKGKHVGVLGVYPEQEQRFRYQLVSLERDDFDETESMIQLMQNYQRDLKAYEIAKIDVVSAAHPSGATYVGADRCGECHTEAYKIWKNTPHAHAFESLNPVHKHEGYERLNGINRTFDPECLACHVTGWDPQEYIRFRSGFLNEEFAETDEQKTLQAVLAGSQCENCHGPGSQHIAAVDSGEDNAGRSVRVTLEESKKNGCTNCHDADNSPHFDFDEYWPKVEHDGLE